MLYATRAETGWFDGMIVTGKWPGIDYRATVLLEGGSMSHSPRRPGTVRIVSYRTTEVVIRKHGDMRCRYAHLCQRHRCVGLAATIC